MIKIENTQVYNIARAIYAARNAFNSWYRSDSDLKNDILGEDDLDLAERLVKAGTDHSKFLRMITVTCDITAPRYWWVQADQYKVGTVSSSTSTMHTITDKEFTLDDFSFEYGLAYSIDIAEKIIKRLNNLRDTYLMTNDKEAWYAIIQLLPQSYNQMRTIQLNYQVLRNMYFARKNHKLNEWKEFCKWIEELPYAKELIVGDE